jgi:hypothetical protein
MNGDLQNSCSYPDTRAHVHMLVRTPVHSRNCVTVPVHATIVPSKFAVHERAEPANAVLSSP